MIFQVNQKSDIDKATSYANRLIEVSKNGIKIDVTKKRTIRSNNQNRYMWGVVYKQIADETGHTIMEIHEIMKQMFLRKEEIIMGDKKFIITKSTAKLKTDEEEIYLEQIRRFASMDLGIVILLPNECPESWDYN